MVQGHYENKIITVGVSYHTENGYISIYTGNAGLWTVRAINFYTVFLQEEMAIFHMRQQKSDLTAFLRCFFKCYLVEPHGVSTR